MRPSAHLARTSLRLSCFRTTSPLTMLFSSFGGTRTSRASYRCWMPPTLNLYASRAWRDRKGVRSMLLLLMLFSRLCRLVKLRHHNKWAAFGRPKSLQVQFCELEVTDCNIESLDAEQPMLLGNRSPLEDNIFRLEQN